MSTKKNPKKWMIVGAAIICLLTACSTVIKNRPDSLSTSEAFDDYMDELFIENAMGSTINLHYTLAYPEKYGITDYPVSLGDYSLEGMEKSYQELKKVKERLAKFDVNQLTENQRLTYDIMMDHVKTELSAEDFILYTEFLEPTTGYQSQLPIILAEYTFRTRQDIEDYLALLSQVDDMYQQIIAFEEKKAQSGLFMTDQAADTVIDQCEEFIKEPENNYMIEVFNDKIEAFEGLSKQEKENYRKENQRLVTTEIVNAYQTLIEGLTGLKGSGKNDLGLCYFDKGREYYKYLVRTNTGSRSSIRKLQKRVEEFLMSYLESLFDAMAENPQIYQDMTACQFPDMEPEEILQDLCGKAERDFPTPPQIDYQVKYVHPTMQEHLNPAFYLTTPVDDIQNNLIYINKKYTDAGGNNELYTTLAHEGYPGHMYQNAYTASRELPLIRNLLSCPGYTEGWATYAEYEYAYDYAGMNETIAPLLAANNAVSLAFCAYIDMGIHYEGWDQSDTAEYLNTYITLGDETINEIFDTIMEEPTSYLSYFIGYLEFLELRKTAKEELGESFDIKQFHDFLLTTGPAPFYIIEDYMEDWINQQL